MKDHQLMDTKTAQLAQNLVSHTVLVHLSSMTVKLNVRQEHTQKLDLSPAHLVQHITTKRTLVKPTALNAKTRKRRSDLVHYHKKLVHL